VLKNTRDKRGISGVVVTILLILLALVAILIIWQVIKPLIQGTAEKVSAECITIDLEILSASYDSTLGDLSVEVKRNPGIGDIKGIRILLNDASETIWTSDNLDEGELANELGLETFDANTGSLTTDPTQVQVAALIESGEGTLSPCSPVVHSVTVTT